MVRTKHATRVAFLVFHVLGHREVIHEFLVDVHAARVASIIFSAVSFGALLFFRRSVDVMQVATSNGLRPRWAAYGRMAGSPTHSQPISARARTWRTTWCSLAVLAGGASAAEVCAAAGCIAVVLYCTVLYAHEKVRGHGTLLDHKPLHVGHWRHTLVKR